MFSIVLRLAIFFAGKWNYKIRPAEGNVMVDVAKCVTVSEGKTLLKIFGGRYHFYSIGGSFNNTNANLL